MGELPYILEYFIPGFIFLRTFQLLTSRKSSDYQLILSVVISYILKAICSVGHNYIFVSTSFSWDWRVIILSSFAFILSIIFVIVSETDFMQEILLKINHKSIHDDIWQDDITYIGILVTHEEKGNDSWFVIKDYIVESANEEYSSSDIPYKSRLALNLRNVKRIELLYGDKNN